MDLVADGADVFRGDATGQDHPHSGILQGFAKFAAGETAGAAIEAVGTLGCINQDGTEEKQVFRIRQILEFIRPECLDDPAAAQLLAVIQALVAGKLDQVELAHHHDLLDVLDLGVDKEADLGDRRRQAGDDRPGRRRLDVPGAFRVEIEANRPGPELASHQGILGRFHSADFDSHGHDGSPVFS